MTVELRAYRPGDEVSICALFEQVFGRPLPVTYWRWRYLDHPAGGPHVELAWDGERLVGHYGASAAALSVRGEQLSAALSMTTMIHPDYRGQRLFERAAERLYARLEEAGAAMVFGFPNAMSHRGFLTRLGWRSLYEIPSLLLMLGEKVEKRRPPPAQIEPVAAFDETFDRHWQESKELSPVWLWRDAGYLRWRYSDNPDHRYRVASWREGEAVRGYAVVKDYRAQGLDLVDLVAADTEVIDGLIAWAIDEARRGGRNQIAAWAPVHSAARMPLEAAGFAAAGPVTYFGGRVLRGFSGHETLYDQRNWSFAMSDSDIF